MLQTKLLQFESDIKEVINLFSVGEQLNIRHDYKESEISKNKIKVVNTIVVGGKCYSFGNLISFCNDIDKIDLQKIGPLFERHEMFPERINTEFDKKHSSND